VLVCAKTAFVGENILNYCIDRRKEKKGERENGRFVSVWLD
jgi:hypothetical protein